MASINHFITDKRIETLNYDLLCTRKDLKEMTLLVQANSTTIADLLGLIRDQNKSLTELRLEVQSLKSELGVLKKGDIVSEKLEKPEKLDQEEKLEKLDQEEFIVESKTTKEEENMAAIPKDDIFRYFEFNKSWQDSELIKKWGDSKVVYGIIFNVVPINAYNGYYNDGLNNYKYHTLQNVYADQDRPWFYVPGIVYNFGTPKSIKNSILEVETFFQEKVDKTYKEVVKNIKDPKLFTVTPFSKPKNLSFSEYLLKGTVKGFFIGNNNPTPNISLDQENSILRISL